MSASTETFCAKFSHSINKVKNTTFWFNMKLNMPGYCFLIRFVRKRATIFTKYSVRNMKILKYLLLRRKTTTTMYFVTQLWP